MPTKNLKLKIKQNKPKGSFSWTFANDIDVKNFLNIH
jgi:hypothetical protein